MPKVLLFCFLVKCFLPAELAILLKFDAVRIVLLVLNSIVISLLALRTRQRYLDSHVLISFRRYST